MKRTIFSWACVIALGLGIALVQSVSVAAQAAKQKKSPSDRTVRVLMGWAFAAVPEKVTTSDGREITIDRSDPSQFMIPIEDARRIIRVAMTATDAKLCDLPELEARTFLTMMAREKALGKWSKKQIKFIQMLHISAGLVITGGFSVGEKTADKENSQQENSKKYKCSEQDRARVKSRIEAYLKEPVKPQ